MPRPRRRLTGRTLSVAIGPFDTAGCATALAAGLREQGVDVELALASVHELGYGRARALSRIERLGFAGRAPSRHDVMHYQFGRTWLPAQADAAWARARGRTLVVSLYGDDCRQYGLARSLYPARGRVGDPAGDAAVRRRLLRLGKLCHAAVVGDLELATYVRPYFRRVYVVPLPLDASPVAPRRGRPPGSRPLVVHAPSDRRIKGTAEIEAATKDLPVELRVLAGMPHSAVLDALAEADVAIDQLNSVTTGIFALEAMRAGLPVLSEIDPEAVGPFQRDSPILAVTAGSLASELESLLGDEPRRLRLGEAGREYVERVHVAPQVAKAVLAVYEHARSDASGLFEATADGVERLDRPV